MVTFLVFLAVVAGSGAVAGQPTWFEHPDALQGLLVVAVLVVAWFYKEDRKKTADLLKTIHDNQVELYSRIRVNENDIAKIQGICEERAKRTQS